MATIGQKFPDITLHIEENIPLQELLRSSFLDLTELRFVVVQFWMTVEADEDFVEEEEIGMVEKVINHFTLRFVGTT